jgi:5-methylcytosine-specific restriction endonuclease McrA
MSNPWFRLYSEFSHDPKVQMMSEAMQRRYIMLMCLRCADSLANVTDEEVAFALRLDEQEMAATKQAFIKKGFIDEDWSLLNWEKRQPESDSSAARVQRYREKRKAMGLSSNGYTKHSETVMQRDGHACVYCESTENLCIDHVKPVNQGGTDDLPNLVTACKACNSGKAGRTPEQAGYFWANKAAEKGRAFCIKIDVFKKKMWFAYVDNSMAWYDLDVAEVKKLMKINSKGQKSIPLEELKTFTGADKVETVDLIQENNLDRFEKKKPNKHRNKNTGNNRAEQVTKEPEAQKDNNRPEKTNAPKKFNKNKKRFPPKRNNND